MTQIDIDNARREWQMAVRGSLDGDLITELWNEYVRVTMAVIGTPPRNVKPIDRIGL